VTKGINGEDQDRAALREKFLEDLRKLEKLEVPLPMRNLLEIIELVKKDEEALEVLREEILKNHGQ
jgi:hypothetical protein